MGRDHRTRNSIGSGKPCSIAARGWPSGTWPTTGTGSASGAGAAAAVRIRHEASQALSQETQARYRATNGSIAGVEQVRSTFFRAPVPGVSRAPSCAASLLLPHEAHASVGADADDEFRINVGAPHQISNHLPTPRYSAMLATFECLQVAKIHDSHYARSLPHPR